MFRRTDHALCGRDIAMEADPPILRHRHLMAVVAEDVEHCLPAAAIDERAMHLND